MPSIDLNSDLGEGLAEEIDMELLDLVSSANIACGGHAGDLESMERTVRAAAARAVRIGAHPSYPDRARFGRVTMTMPPSALEHSIVEQTRSLAEVCERLGAEVAYLKPHGALYNDAAWNSEVGRAVIQAASRLSLPLMILADSSLARSAPGALREGFIDRAYNPDGSLVPRTEPGAVISEAGVAAEQALALAERVDSLCIHSDTPRAADLLRAAREALEAAGYAISAERR